MIAQRRGLQLDPHLGVEEKLSEYASLSIVSESKHSELQFFCSQQVGACRFNTEFYLGLNQSRLL